MLPLITDAFSPVLPLVHPLFQIHDFYAAIYGREIQQDHEQKSSLNSSKHRVINLRSVWNENCACFKFSGHYRVQCVEQMSMNHLFDQ